MKTTNSTSVSARRSRRGRRLWRVLLVVAGGALMLAGGGWAWLQSGAGRQWLLGTASARLDGVGGQHFRMAGLEGRVPTHMVLDTLAVSDADGEWVEVRELELAWSLRTLLRERRIAIRLVRAREVEMRRIPTWVSAPTAGAGGSIRLPPLAVETVSIPHIALDAGLLGHAAEVALSGTVAITPGGDRASMAVRVHDTNQADARVQADVEYRHASRTLAVDAGLTAPPDGFLANLLQSSPAGEITARLAGSGTIVRWEGRIEAEASRWGTLDATFAAGGEDAPWAGATGRVVVIEESVAAIAPEAFWVLEIRRLPAGNWRLAPQLEMPTLAATLAGDVAVDSATRLAEGTVEATFGDLRRVADLFDAPVDGAGTLTLELHGENGRQAAQVETALRDLAVAQIRIGNLAATARSGDLLDPWGKPLDIHVASAELDVTVEGQVSVGRDPVGAAGTLAIVAPTLAPLTTLAGYVVEGRAEATVTLLDENGRQAATLDLIGADLASQHGTLGRIEARARIPDARNPAAFTVESTAREAGPEGYILDRVVAELNRSGEAWNFRAEAEGTLGKPVWLRAGGQATLTSNGQAVELRDLAGSFGTVPAGARTPVRLRHEAARWTLDPLELELAGATVNLAGHFAPDSLTAECRFRDVAWSALPVDLSTLSDGHIQGRIAVSGTPAEPTVEASLETSLVTAEDFRDLGLPAIGFAATAKLDGGRLAAEAFTRDNPVGTLQARLSMPLTVSIQPFAWDRPEDDELGSSIHGDLDLAFLNRLPAMANQRVQGRLTADLAYQGPQRDFALAGDMHLRDGAYEHFVAGTTIRNVSADLQARNKTLVLDRFSATDGGTGTLSAGGAIDLSPDRKFPFTARLGATSATVVRQDHVTAAVSADLEIRGDASQVGVTGTVSVVSGEFHIDRLPPSPPPTLDFTERGRDPVPAPPAPTPSMSRRLRGDLIIDVPGPFFVRGAGLESDWRGSLRLRSDGGPWQAKGAFTPRRGTYEFFGRPFTLVNSGVYLEGSQPIVPTLDVTAEYERPEIRTQLRVTGPLGNPVVKLESEPDLPQDEILARTMFGTSATGLTPIQTAQLGLAMASTARRSESTFDFMGRTRNRLGVDELNLRENADDPNQVELVAGRYVSDRLFIEYSHGIGSARDSGVRAEFEINRHLSLETNAGAQMRPGIRLNIKTDY